VPEFLGILERYVEGRYGAREKETGNRKQGTGTAPA
jgi:hypothetical protein